MSEPLQVRTGVDGNEYYWQRYVEVGEPGEAWVSGCGSPDMATWERLQCEAAVIASALAPADTVERQMALAVLAGDNAAALALADRLVETRRAGEDVWGGLLKVVRAMLARMNKSGWRLIDYDDELTAIREAVRKAEGK